MDERAMADNRTAKVSLSLREKQPNAEYHGGPNPERYRDTEEKQTTS